jgi:serine protease Do
MRAGAAHCFRFAPLLGWLAAAAVSAAPRDIPAFTALIAKQTASVVNISSGLPTTRERAPATDPLGAESAPGPGSGQSLGSGVLISADGYILTCAHVVEDAREISVRLSDRRELSARVIGADRRSDIALIKVDATRLPKAVIGDPNKLEVGEWVLAIGSPFGFEASATTGIVSAKGRSLPNEHYVPFIQTDAAINPGNSGGPLFNLKGEVVGINSQIFSRTGGFMGLSFAIPIDIAMRLAEQLRQEGYVRRGWLGINTQDVSRDLAAAYGLPKPRGALIADILPGGPASRSDLRRGDIVLDYDGQPIDLASELSPRIGLTLPGHRANLTVFRRDQGQQLLTVTVGELKDDGARRVPARPRTPGSGLGLILAEMNPADRKRLDLDGGVVVRNLEDGPARDAGLQAGDVLLEIEGKRASTVAEAYRLLAHAPKTRPLLVRIQRGAVSRFVALRVAG